MLLKLSVGLIFSLGGLTAAFAQNQDATMKAVRGQINKTTTTTTQEEQPPASTSTTQRTTRTQTTTRTATKTPSAASDPTAQGVLTAFDALVAGIQKADVNAVMGLYWDSPQLTIFNNNGSITRSWEQMRANRESLYRDVKNVQLEIRNRNIHMMGREGAVVTCQWTQTQTFRGTTESASGRLTVIYRRIGTAWKIIHTHTSPEAPDQSRLMPSERNTPTTTPTATPQRTLQNKP
jgi:ketosteroid isomerase-like protein